MLYLNYKRRFIPVDPFLNCQKVADFPTTVDRRAPLVAEELKNYLLPATKVQRNWAPSAPATTASFEAPMVVAAAVAPDSSSVAFAAKVLRPNHYSFQTMNNRRCFDWLKFRFRIRWRKISFRIQHRRRRLKTETKPEPELAVVVSVALIAAESPLNRPIYLQQIFLTTIHLKNFITFSFNHLNKNS